jgi:hypothetical protein
MLEVFRADTRRPDIIQNQNGFDAWQPLDFKEAKSVLKKFCGSPDNLDLKSKNAERLINNLLSPRRQYDKAARRYVNIGGYLPLNKNDLSRLIKSQKTRDSFWISTDESEACGGQANGYIYRIVIESNAMDLPGVKSFASKIGSQKKEKESHWVRLLMDSSVEMIALNISGSAGAEISFLTRIPATYIIAFKPLVADPNLKKQFGEADNKGWYLMKKQPVVLARQGRMPPPVPSRSGRPALKLK